MLTTYIDARLVQWATWRARREDAGIGFPRQTAFSRGIPQPANLDAWLPAMHEDAAEIDACVCALSDFKREVIFQVYVLSSSMPQKLSACSCCERTFYNRLHAAKVDILGFLNDLACGISLPSRVDVKKTA